MTKEQLRTKASEVSEAIEKNNIDGADLIFDLLIEVRNSAIEECAKVASGQNELCRCGDHISEQIRALSQGAK